MVRRRSDLEEKIANFRKKSKREELAGKDGLFQKTRNA